MIDPASATAVRDARLAWIVGGSLLIAYAVFVLALNASWMYVLVGAKYVLDALWAAALLVLALGVRRSGSVVARRPLGVGALVVAAVLPVVSTVVWWLVPLQATDRGMSVMIGQSLQVLSLAAIVVACVVIARAGAVPHRVRWVPLIVVAVSAGVQVLVQAAAVAAPGILQQTGFTTLIFGASTLSTLAILLLGVLAIAFAPREQAVAPPPAVQVYPPAS